MKYLVLAYYDVKAFESMSKERLDAMVSVCKELDKEFLATGQVHSVASLALPKEWKTIKAMRGKGKPAHVDGPYMETKEHVGAFFIVEAKDMDDALAVASKHPGVHIADFLDGALEVCAVDFYQEPGKVTEGVNPAQ